MSDDLISRQAAIDAFEKELSAKYNKREFAIGFVGVKSILENLPSVQPRKGKWIEHEWAEKYGGCLISNYECSVCGEWVRENSDFCPNCGADMRSKAREYLEYGKEIAKGIEQGLRGDA